MKTGQWYHGGMAKPVQLDVDTGSDASSIKTDSTPTHEKRTRFPNDDRIQDGQGSEKENIVQNNKGGGGGGGGVIDQRGGSSSGVMDRGGGNSGSLNRTGSLHGKELKRQLSMTDRDSNYRGDRHLREQQTGEELGGGSGGRSPAPGGRDSRGGRGGEPGYPGPDRRPPPGGRPTSQNEQYPDHPRGGDPRMDNRGYYSGGPQSPPHLGEERSSRERGPGRDGRVRAPSRERYGPAGRGDDERRRDDSRHRSVLCPGFVFSFSRTYSGNNIIFL